MAVSQDDWTVEQLGTDEETVRMEMADGEDCDTVVRFVRSRETVEFHVDDGVGEPVGDVAPWALSVAERVGIRVEQ